MSQDVLNQILNKLTAIENRLTTIKTDMGEVKDDLKSLKSKFDLFESNQQTFHELLRETRLEMEKVSKNNGYRPFKICPIRNKVIKSYRSSKIIAVV